MILINEKVNVKVNECTKNNDVRRIYNKHCNVLYKITMISW